MVALGMLPKEDFHQLKGRMEALETQNAYLIEVVTSLASCHGGAFVPPVGNQPGPESSDITARRGNSGPTFPQGVCVFSIGRGNLFKYHVCIFTL